MIDAILSAGSFAMNVAWGITSAHYMFNSNIYESIREGKGMHHPGFGNVWGYGIGAMMAKGLDTDLGKVIPDVVRHPMQGFLRAGTVWSGLLGFDTEDADWEKVANMRSGRGKDRWGRPAGGTSTKDYLKALDAHDAATGKRALVRGIGTAGSLMTNAALIGGVVMPLAYSAGVGLVRSSQGLANLTGSLTRNTMDWGSMAASSVMLSHASTERQRSKQVMEQARMTGRNFMGQEAQMLHR
jgi:hypothetical protein